MVLSRHLHPEKYILISTVKRSNEFPYFLRTFRYLQAYRLLSGAQLIKYAPGPRQRLTEVATQLLTLLVGGTETLPKVMAGGVYQLRQHPDQRAALAAQPPDLINYQGVLRDSQGNALSGSYPMVFRFFSAETGGDEILVNTHAAVSVTDGLFSVALGGLVAGGGDAVGRMAGVLSRTGLPTPVIGSGNRGGTEQVVCGSFGPNYTRRLYLDFPKSVDTARHF